MVPSWAPVKKRDIRYPYFVRYSMGQANWRCQCELAECNVPTHEKGRKRELRCLLALSSDEPSRWKFHRGQLLCEPCVEFRYDWELSKKSKNT